MKKILIIEDEPQLQQMYKQKLSDEGYQVLVTPSGADGLSLAKDKSPSVILLDIILPNTHMNGFDVLEQLKANPIHKAIPVIVLTNLDTEQKTALDIGAVDYVVKTNISLDEVVLKIKNNLQQFWSECPDSNRGPPRPKRGALPTALHSVVPRTELNSDPYSYFNDTIPEAGILAEQLEMLKNHQAQFTYLAS